MAYSEHKQLPHLQVIRYAGPASSAITGFWYKVNANPDRAGRCGQPAIGRCACKCRTTEPPVFGIREHVGGNSASGANVGNGTADSRRRSRKGRHRSRHRPWIYNTGNNHRQGSFLSMERRPTDPSAISWAGCDILMIGSGNLALTNGDYSSMPDRRTADLQKGTDCCTDQGNY